MTHRARARRDQLTLVFGMTVIGILVGSAHMWPRLRAWQYAQAGRASAIADDLAAAASARRALPALEDSLRARRALLVSLDSSLIHAPTAAIAGAETASIVERLAREARVILASQQITADSGALSGLRRVSVRMVATAGLEEFAAFLDAMSTGAPLLSVREMSVARADPTAASTRSDVLRLDLTIDALCVIDAAAVATR